MSIKNNESLANLIVRAQRHGKINRLSVMEVGGELPGHIMVASLHLGAIAAYEGVEENLNGDLEVYGDYTLHVQTWQENEAREILGIY